MINKSPKYLWSVRDIASNNILFVTLTRDFARAWRNQNQNTESTLRVFKQPIQDVSASPTATVAR